MSIKRHVPNFITLLNLLCGSLAIIFIMKDEPVTAVYLILIATLMDFLDGFSARVFNAYSVIGKELDSLADLVSFGLAPSLLLYSFYDLYLQQNHPEWTVLSFIPMTVVLAAALRLAIFNTDTQQKSTFKGLPTPANAILISMIFCSIYSDPFIGLIVNSIITIPLISILLSILMVSKIPMFSLKIKGFNYSDNKNLYHFLIISLILAGLTLLTGSAFTTAILVIFLNYILFNIILFLFRKPVNS